MIFHRAESYRTVSPNDRCVLLDGCFDPLHFGHVKYLRTVARVFTGWTVVVAVAPDDEIRSKGREPLFGQMTRCAIVDGLKGVDVVIAKDRPTHEILSALKPRSFVKGKDWEGKLDPDILAECSLQNIQVLYIGDTLDSSTERLRAWALHDADASLDRLEAFMAQQTPTDPAKYNREYFEGAWRAGGNRYTPEKRRELEGRHPDILAEVFAGMTVMDYGCGPGYLVQMLRERGIRAYGYEPSMEALLLAPKGTRRYLDCVVAMSSSADYDEPIQRDVVVCREVLEHVPVMEIAPMVQHLFRVARKYVYITTRFNGESVFDAATDFETDPTHITCLTQPFLRSLCVLNGGKRRKDLEQRLDWMGKGRVLVYECS